MTALKEIHCLLNSYQQNQIFQRLSRNDLHLLNTIQMAITTYLIYDNNSWKSYVRILLLKQMHELSHKTLIRFFLMISMWTFKSAFFLSTERVILFAFGCSPSHNNFSLTSRVWKKRWTNKHSGMRKVSLSSDNAPWFY